MAETNSRQYISALSILAVAVFVGVPVWWKTTEVYRCPLPYHDIIQLASQPVVPEIAIKIHISSLFISSRADVESLVGRLQREVSTSSVVSKDTRVKIRFDIEYKEIDASVLSSLNESLTLEELSRLISPSLTSTVGTYNIILAHTTDTHRVWVSPHRHALVAIGDGGLSEAHPSVLYLLRSVYGNKQALEQVLTTISRTHHDKVDEMSRRQLRSSSGYQLTFTLVVPDPNQLTTSWNIQQATEELLQPFLKHTGISSLARFSISSQVFYFTDVKLRPKKTDSYFSISSSQLPPVISIVESKLASHVSQLPALNFIIFLPTPSQSPLFIKTSNDITDTFLVPQWGGMVIHNSPADNGTVHVRMERAMSVFIEQLQMLLGVPPKVLPSELIQCCSGEFGVTDYQIDQLLMAKMVESVSMATTSLISLVQLLDKVKNMVISDHIQKQVEASLNATLMCYKLSSESELKLAYDLAATARDSAEVAFFDPSILELLYFPDDQKFAIYIPLFLPISVPILLSSIAALKWISTIIRNSRKQKTE